MSQHAKPLVPPALYDLVAHLEQAEAVAYVLEDYLPTRLAANSDEQADQLNRLTGAQLTLLQLALDEARAVLDELDVPHVERKTA